MAKRRATKGNIIPLLFIAGFYIIFLLGELIEWISTLPKMIWLLLMFFLIFLIATKIHLKKLKTRKLKDIRRLELKRQGQLNVLKKMNPLQFEQYIADLFNELGYEAIVTKATGDGGKDILLHKKNYFGIIECKRYDKTKITRPQIQQFHSAVIDCKAEEGYFIATSDFTSKAALYVLDKPIKLINGVELIKLIDHVTSNHERFSDTEIMPDQT